MDDAWTVLSYLSEADLLLDDSFGARAKYNVAEGVQQAAAASVAVRGALFGNFHPLPPRFLLLQNLFCCLHYDKRGQS